MYWVNELGEIFSDYTKVILKQHKGDYRSVSLIRYEDDGTRIKSTQNVHVLVARSFIPRKADDQNWVNHIDGNKWNNKHSNLEWVTAKENTLHAIATGLMKPYGKDYPMFGKNHTKLTREKMSKARKGNPKVMGANHFRSIPVVGTHIETGEKVSYESSNIAATSLKLSQGNIASVIKGNRHSCGGYHWAQIK